MKSWLRNLNVYFIAWGGKTWVMLVFWALVCAALLFVLWR